MVLVRAEPSWCDYFRLLDVWRPSAVCSNPAEAHDWPAETCYYRTPEEEPEDHSDQHIVAEVDSCKSFWTLGLGKAECLKGMRRKITARPARASVV